MTHSSDPALTVEVVTTVARLEELRPDFARLEAAGGATLPFSLHEWQLAWLRHFPRHGRGVSDEPLFHVVRRRDGACVGILPFILTRRTLGPLKFVSLGLLGADPAITEIRSAAVEPAYAAEVAQAVHSQLNANRGWDWIHWTGESGPFADALGRLRGLDWEPAPASFVLDLPATWELFRAGLKRNIRESLRHCYNSLQRDGHALKVTVADNPVDVHAALEHLFALHALRANMPGAVPHPDRFAAPWLRSFMHEACGALAARGVMRVFQIEIGAAVVASRLGFVVADCLYLYYSGFDPSWARYSVMTTTVAEAIQYAIGQGLKTVNLSPGEDVSKTRWGPRQVPYVQAYEHGGRWLSRLVRHAYVKARSGSGPEGWLLQRLIPGRRNWD